GQAQQDTLSYLEQQATVYLTKMYGDKNFDSASKMWDSRVLLEMEDFYQKEGQGHFTGATLISRIKEDIRKYFEQMDEFKIEKMLSSSLETEGSFIIGYVFFEYTVILQHKLNQERGMLVFVSEDRGKSWAVQDWHIKGIADV